MKLDASFHKHVFSANQRQHITREFRVVEESYNCDSLRVLRCVVKERVSPFRSSRLILLSFLFICRLSVSGMKLSRMFETVL